MKLTLIGLLLIFSIIDILLIGFVQTSKSNGLSGITGEGLTLFKQTKVRGTEKNIQNLVIVSSVSILIIIFLLSYVI